ncbi:MAG: hypothetical protein JWO86_7209 [Myxococcaceae bacterium]|nr:hypothetical protein [Myxococcaceae bacterium]
MTLALALLGLCAGALTTLAGQGGGLFLLLILSVLVGPRAALAITAPALLLGNLHRAVLFRKAVDRSIALRMVMGAVPGAFAGGLLAGALPEWTLKAMLVGLTVLAIARALRWLRFDVPRWALGPAGFVIGSMTGTAGGAGVLFAPVMLSAGLTGRAFVGTVATVAFATHAGRVVAYASNGLFTRDLLVPIVVVSAAIAVGNALGERLRARLSDLTTTRLEYGVLVICVAVSLSGLK